MNTREILRVAGLATVVAVAPVAVATALYAQEPAPSAQEQAQQSAPAEAAPPSITTDGSEVTTGARSPDIAVQDVPIGSSVFDLDGEKIGEVEAVKPAANGAIEEIHVKTSGILGFGGRTIAIPGEKISEGGQNVRVALNSTEVDNLPDMTEPKG